MLRKHFDLDESLEDLAYRAIGCCVKVHCELGPGLIEKAYDRALRLELSASSASTLSTRFTLRRCEAASRCRV